MAKSREHIFIFRMLREALEERAEEAIPEGLNWKYIYQFCKYQKIDNLIAYRFEKIGEGSLPDEIRQKFKEAKQLGIAREATQYFALEEIKQSFETNQIKMLPLKGSKLKEYYPSADMRFLTDLDILCQKEDQERIDTILRKLGYRLEHEGDVHDVYVRAPFMTVEIHWSCYTRNEVLNTYFDQIWEKSQLVDGSQFVYQMSWEDFYLFMVAHLEKHLRYSGVGIRMLLDLFLFQEKIRENCDSAYVQEMLKKADLDQFERTMTRFIVQCFEGDEAFFEKNMLIRHVLENGAQGTSSHTAGNLLLTRGTRRRDIFLSRIQVLLSIVFPSLRGMKINYPFLETYPFFLPAAWLHRIVVKGIQDPKKCKTILMRPFKRKDAKKMKQVYEEAGVKK